MMRRTLGLKTAVKTSSHKLWALSSFRASYPPWNPRDLNFLNDTDLDSIISKSMFLNASVAQSQRFSPSKQSRQHCSQPLSEMCDNLCLIIGLNGSDTGAIPIGKGRTLVMAAWALLRQGLSRLKHYDGPDLVSAVESVMSLWHRRRTVHECQSLLLKDLLGHCAHCMPVHRWSERMWFVCGSFALKMDRTQAIELMDSLLQRCEERDSGGDDDCDSQRRQSSSNDHRIPLGCWLTALRVWNVKEAPMKLVHHSGALMPRLKESVHLNSGNMDGQSRVLNCMAYVMSAYFQASRISPTNKSIRIQREDYNHGLSSLGSEWMFDMGHPIMKDFLFSLDLFADASIHANQTELFIKTLSDLQRTFERLESRKRTTTSASSSMSNPQRENVIFERILPEYYASLNADHSCSGSPSLSPSSSLSSSSQKSISNDHHNESSDSEMSWNNAMSLIHAIQVDQSEECLASAAILKLRMMDMSSMLDVSDSIMDSDLRSEEDKEATHQRRYDRMMQEYRQMVGLCLWNAPQYMPYLIRDTARMVAYHSHQSRKKNQNTSNNDGNTSMLFRMDPGLWRMFDLGLTLNNLMHKYYHSNHEASSMIYSRSLGTPTMSDQDWRLLLEYDVHSHRHRTHNNHPGNVDECTLQREEYLQSKHESVAIQGLFAQSARKRDECRDRWNQSSSLSLSAKMASVDGDDEECSMMLSSEDYSFALFRELLNEWMMTVKCDDPNGKQSAQHIWNQWVDFSLSKDESIKPILRGLLRTACYFDFKLDPRVVINHQSKLTDPQWKWLNDLDSFDYFTRQIQDILRDDHHSDDSPESSDSITQSAFASMAAPINDADDWNGDDHSHLPSKCVDESEHSGSSLWLRDIDRQYEFMETMLE